MIYYIYVYQYYLFLRFKISSSDSRHVPLFVDVLLFFSIHFTFQTTGYLNCSFLDPQVYLFVIV